MRTKFRERYVSYFDANYVVNLTELNTFARFDCCCKGIATYIYIYIHIILLMYVCIIIVFT